ncbi:MAG: VWA domain-containing protein, partial [Acidobacteriota bacterium]|nr:VWA domain-containing protein [Acidobacteriota bacterium]
MRCSTWILFLALLAAGTAVFADKPLQDGLSDDWAVDEDVRVRRVVWPVVVRDKPGGPSCDVIGPTDIVLEEDGAPVVITHVETPAGLSPGTESPRVPIVHALLIDTSVSMRINDRLRHAKEAAMRYVDLLPDGEEVLVAAFDDSLVLVSPPTTDRARTRDDIERVESGNWTALWDAVYDLVLYLETLPGQKVAVLLTDGHDHTSISRLAPKSILELVAETSDITLFTVGVDLIRPGRIERSATRSFLQQLAAATGGKYYETRGVGVFNEVFDRIRTRLSRQFYVVYVPQPFGAGPKDDRRAGFRHRNVRVRPGKGVPCKVVSAGPPTRIEGKLETPPATPRETGITISDEVSSLARCVNLPASAHVARELSLPAPNGLPVSRQQTPSLFVLDPPAEILPGRAPDILLDRGVLYHDRAYRNAGKFKTSIDRDPEIEMREFAVDVPAFGEVRDALHRPEDVMLHLLEREYCAPGSAHHEHGRSPLLVHGKTFLEMRRLIGLALFEHYPEYREWATGRLVEEAEPDVERLLADLGAEHPLTPAQTEVLRNALLEQRARNPENEMPQRFLAEWLGDIPARDLALALETRLANALLGADDDVDRRDLAAGIAETGWALLLDWFPPATEVRILSPLVPAYDAERDTIGFFRVILPRPNFDGPPEDPVPEEPLALRTVQWLLEEDSVGRALDGIGVESVEHASLERHERR